jgi:hypothetical protein
VSAYVDGGKKVIRILTGLGALDKRIQAALGGAAEASPAAPVASPSP